MKNGETKVIPADRILLGHPAIDWWESLALSRDLKGPLGKA